MPRCRRAGLRPLGPGGRNRRPARRRGHPRAPAAGIHASGPLPIDHHRPIDDLTAGSGAGAALRRARRVIGAVAALVIVATACSGGDDGDRAGGDGRGGETTTTTAAPRPHLEPGDKALPTVLPTPVATAWLGPDLPVAGHVEVTTHVEVDGPTRAALDGLLEGGAASGPGLEVTLGALGDAAVARVLDDAGVDVPPPIPSEGYVLAAVSYGPDAPGRLVVAAHDPAGWFYAVQTLAQLVTPDGSIRGVSVVDRPAMPVRGAIEGFYGSPWTHEERVGQLAFYGRVKLNTYVYAPKDDPYHRDRWREPYPADQLDRLGQLVDAAAAHHVRFTFAVSPGVSICYSDPADTQALVAKLQALHDLGVRAFNLALDDIDTGRWNCPGDAAAYGPPSMEAAARAQVALANTVQRTFVAPQAGTHPLQFVPTEYRGVRDSGYRTALRDGLDPAVEVMWTGRYVVPPGITVADAEAAASVYGRAPLVWDNTPVNDFPPTEGRLLLGPYAHRERGLSAHVAGLVLNPMNQAAASTVALTGAADFAWNDAAYDPARAHRVAAARLLAAPPAGAAGGGTGGDPPDDDDVDALLAFFDLENLAPTSASDGTLSQPQAPALAAELDAFRASWEAGDSAGALDRLRPYAERLQRAPGVVREEVGGAFAADTEPWLAALDSWSAALLATLDALAARAAGDTAAADAAFAESDRLVAQAEAVHTVEGETRPQGPVRVGDGVLDTFLDEAKSLA